MIELKETTIVAAAIGGAIGGILGLLGSISIYFFQTKEEKRKIKRDKLEEAFKEVIKIEILIFHINKFYSYKLSGFSEIEGFEVEEPQFKTKASREQLKMLLSLYSKEFKEDIREFDKEWNNLYLEKIDFFNILKKESKENIAIKALNAGTELLNICENMKCKIKDIFEKEYI